MIECSYMKTNGLIYQINKNNILMTKDAIKCYQVVDLIKA